MAVVLAVALAIGITGDRTDRTVEDRVESIASTIRCPTCRSQSAADSDAPTARAVRAEVLRRVEAGESAGEIRSYFASRYGEEILLTPPASGVAGLVWVLPVAAVVAAAGGLGFAFASWRR